MALEIDRMLLKRPVLTWTHLVGWILVKITVGSSSEWQVDMEARQEWNGIESRVE